jgi:hypothetical protein
LELCQEKSGNPDLNDAVVDLKRNGAKMQLLKLSAFFTPKKIRKNLQDKEKEFFRRK